MTISSYFAALVSFDPSTPARKSYQTIPVASSRGSTPQQIVLSFERQGEIGRIFNATDIHDAEHITATMLPHPDLIADIQYVPNSDLRERHAIPG